MIVENGHNWIQLSDVKKHFKSDVKYIKSHPLSLIKNLFKQSKEFRHWEWMWIKVSCGLIKVYSKWILINIKLYFLCFMNGIFPWEIK